MKKITFVSFVCLVLMSCTSVRTASAQVPVISKMDTLLSDKISIRAIAISGDKVYYGADKSRVGYKSVVDASKFERAIQYDSLAFEFRSCAVTENHVFFLNVGNPAVLYRFSKNLITKEIVYTEKNEKVFYDSMQFWNNQEGIAIGDPTENCLSVIITRDGGKTWTKIPCENLPKVVDGEAAFAASNTNVIVKGNSTWIVSGGKQSRVFYSPDKGNTWKVYTTPIVQGEAMTGIFTADFYDEKTGCIAGGNYEKQLQNFQNKAITFNGGKTWKLIGENTGFGYASCIQFFPEGKGEKLLSVGGTGIFVSIDKGTTWTQLSPDNSFYTIRFIDAKTAILAGKNKIVKVTFSQ
ncbi:MAG: oxidoreductase [Flavobacteriales bacterium]|nr:oxidoreductase [Flavobacteriales bacterium]